MLRIIGLAMLAAVLAFVGFSYYVSQPVFDGLRGQFEPLIADRAEALTFARSGEGLILVSAHEGDAIRGINLTELYGQEATEDLIAFASSLAPESLAELNLDEKRYALNDLLMPLGYSYPSLAAGTNFREHAQEIYSDDPPFLFPKLVDAGPWDQEVPFTSRLDYEAEICMFPLADITDPASLPPFGLVLCNDFTDRWTLIREIDLGQPLGFTGFAAGKGCNSCLPTGYLVVIPRSPDFYRALGVRLYVNNTLRQEFSMEEMILSIEELVAEAFRMREASYWKGDEPVPLFPGDDIPKGTLVLTGTGAGVLFKPANIWNPSFYLRAGDEVITEASYLGHLRNRIGDD